MPSKSGKQARFMAAAAHNPDFAKRVGIKRSVAQEFNEADTGTKRLSSAMRKKRYQGGGLASMARQRMGPPARGGLPQQRPGGLRRPMQQKMTPPRQSPGMGGLGRYAATRGASGQPRRPMQRAGAQGAYNRIGQAGQVPNGLLRSAQGPSGQYRNQLNRLMGGLQNPSGRQQFAKGGSVKKAIAALNQARSMLHDSDPDFDHIATLLAKDVPAAKGLASKIRKTASQKPKTKDPDEFRPAWQEINKEFARIKKSLSE